MAAAQPNAITFEIVGPIVRSDLEGLSRRVCRALEQSGALVALCVLDGVKADAVAVDALARLKLAAHRHGCEMKLDQPSAELRSLIAFVGLEEVL
jgi:ABC-type transporter Mla MlaB component